MNRCCVRAHVSNEASVQRPSSASLMEAQNGVLKVSTMLSAFRRAAVQQRAFSTVLPRVTAKRPTEAGPGGRSSNAGVKVAIFGASGFLGRYVCFDLGT